MIDAIVYSSLSGSCEEYAHRMSAALHVPFFTEQSHICPIGRKVVYIGWLLAGKVVGLNKAKERYNVVGVVSVGMGAPAANAEEVCRKKNGLGADIAVFPLQGRFDLKRLPLPDRAAAFSHFFFFLFFCPASAASDGPVSVLLSPPPMWSTIRIMAPSSAGTR